jgi:hypothetical protein
MQQKRVLVFLVDEIKFLVNLFRDLVGDKYEAFLNSSETQFIIEDLDDMGLQGFASGVAGLYTLMENIILYNGKNEFWCAVIEDEKVYYFTNSSRFKEMLPKTIESWRENFMEKEVIYNAR